MSEITKKPQMMICPKAKECKEWCPEKHNKPHEKNGKCEFNTCMQWVNSGACIPYVEPSSSLEHQEHIRYDPDDGKPCVEWTYLKQPEPSMPLIDTEPTCIKCLAKKRGKRIDCPRLVYGYCKKHLEAQRDADMAWHLEKVQQVRKATLLEVAAEMLSIGDKMLRAEKE
jgi:hypothetical protein